MDASEIRNRAIPYYACFVCSLMQLPGTTLTIDEIQQSSKIQTEDNYDEIFLLNDIWIIEQAIDFLEEENIIVLVTDEFAPSIVIQHQNFSTNSDLLFRRPDSVFSKFELAGEGRRAWLRRALSNIHSKLVGTEGVANADRIPQSEASADNNLWEPIPLDRADQLQEEAAGALDRIVEELRADNGYNATSPEEKTFVQDKLSAAARRLRDDSQISWMYLNEFALKPLGILIKRFGPAAIGVSASLAKDTIISWLKSKGLGFLDDFLK